MQVLNFDIHLVKDFRGVRYIERITECIPVEEKNEYTFDHRKEKTLEGKFDKFMDNAAIFFGKTTNRELYKYRNVMEYVNDAYVLTNPISETNIKEMRINMEDTDMVAFDKFLERNWGIKPPKMRMGNEPQDLDKTPEVKEAIPVSAEPVKKRPVQRVPSQKTAQARPTDGVRKQMPRKNGEEQATKPMRPRQTTDSNTAKTKPNKSSILGKFDVEDDE